MHLIYCYTHNIQLMLVLHLTIQKQLLSKKHLYLVLKQQVKQFVLPQQNYRSDAREQPQRTK